MSIYKSPGVYNEVILPDSPGALQTGVPVFLGFTEDSDIAIHNMPQCLTYWKQFENKFSTIRDKDNYLWHAVYGFFANGGQQCYVVCLDNNRTAGVEAALQAGLKALEALNTIDLVCAPAIMQQGLDPARVDTLQNIVLQHCDTMGDRLAILDALPPSGQQASGQKADPQAQIEAVCQQRYRLQGTNGALYFPWIDVGVRDAQRCPLFVPPCGHVAGIYARSDRRTGVYKAPANEVVEGVVDLSVNVTDSQQGLLNPVGINALRAFPGRGIRLWGARTLSAEAAWTYVNVRRLFLTAGRWIERHMASAMFEPNNPQVWSRIQRELTAYCNALFQRGALQGTTPEVAFFVKCDEETNPPERRDAGQVMTEIGLAPSLPSEFVIVRIVHSASGITISGPTQTV